MSKGLFIVDLVDLALTVEDCRKIESAIQEAVSKELASIDQTINLESMYRNERRFEPMGFFPPPKPERDEI